MHTEGVEFKARKLFKFYDIYWLFRNNMVMFTVCMFKDANSKI